jgi:hypothetical protein
MVVRTAQADFLRARRKAFIRELISTLKREPNWLLSFEEVQRTLPIRGQRYAGVQQVPVRAIVGSVNRYKDFDRWFLPTQTETRPRWESVDRAVLTDVVLPPVQLYKVGDAYFVKDGNHRVSVAREKGVEYIDAEVIDCTTSVPLSPDVDPRDLLLLAEYARFLEQTHLRKHRPEVDIKFTSLGRYDVLLEHISAHRWYMGIEQNRPVEWEEAVVDWYDNVYMPVVKVIQENDILKDFPGHTAGDLYLWIMDHLWYLRQDTGEEVGVHTAALSYDVKYGKWTRKVVRYLRNLKKVTMCPILTHMRGIRKMLLLPRAPAGQQSEQPSEGQ